jgi:hypothetical protein
MKTYGLTNEQRKSGIVLIAKIEKSQGRASIRNVVHAEAVFHS